MANGKRMDGIAKYVEGACQHFLSAHRDIEKVEYRFQASTHRSYLKMTYAYGFANYYDVTDLTEGNLCAMLCVIVAGAEVNTTIKDLDIVREVEKLFK